MSKKAMLTCCIHAYACVQPFSCGRRVCGCSNKDAKLPLLMYTHEEERMHPHVAEHLKPTNIFSDFGERIKTRLCRKNYNF